MKKYARSSKPDAGLNAEDIIGLIEDYHRSGMTQRKFASEHSIAYSTFTLWLSRSRKGLLKKSDAKWLEINSHCAPSQSEYILEIPGGMILRVNRGFDRQEVGDLIGLIRQTCSH